MKSFACKTAVLTFASILLLVRYAESCTCLPTHPQQHYCNSDFVILARVKKVMTTTDMKIYKIRIRKEYKMSEKAKVALKSGRLLTQKDGSMCGVDLNVGELYVIGGKVTSLQARINLCNLVESWKSLTNRQRKGLKRMYHHGCHCNVRTCIYGSCGGSRNQCSWKSPFTTTGTCIKKYGFCLRSAHGNCVWVKNAAMNTCLRNSTAIH